MLLLIGTNASGSVPCDRDTSTVRICHSTDHVIMDGGNALIREDLVAMFVF